MTTISPLLYKSAEDELPTIWRVFIVGGETDILFSPDGKNGQRVKETEYVGGGIFDRKMYTTAIKGSTLPPITNRQWKELPYMFDIESLVQFYVTPTIMKIIGCDTNYPYNYSFINSSVGLQEEKRALQRLNQIINDPKTSINAQRSFKQLYTTIRRSFETAVDNLASNDGILDTVKNAFSGFFQQTQTTKDKLEEKYKINNVKEYTNTDNENTGRKAVYDAFLQQFDETDFDFQTIDEINDIVKKYIFEKYPRNQRRGNDKKYFFDNATNGNSKMTTEAFIKIIDGDVNKDWIPDIVWEALKERIFDTNVIIYDGENVTVQLPINPNTQNVIVLKNDGNNWNLLTPKGINASTSAKFIDKV